MPKNDVVITFDDGFSDFLENAVPVLSEHQYPATIFVVTDEVGGSSKWESRELQKPLLNWKELVEVSRMGYHIGSHGIHHRRLIQLCDIELEMEVVNSKKKIEDQIGFPVKTFSYPWGEHSIREINAIKKAGYDCAVAVSPRGKLDSLLGNRSDTDPYCLSRVGIRNADSLNSFACKVGVLKECDLEVVKGLFSLAKRPKK
ncbi:MAG: polysaccharide deacetylase family protein [Chloroflexi bacterium]|nr:polysaccharide deacetylase family protein [Chloroflexota bacterium]